MHTVQRAHNKTIQASPQDPTLLLIHNGNKLQHILNQLILNASQRFSTVLFSNFTTSRFC
jgi:hypothetical protein